MKINGRKKRYLKLIGNPRKPAKVVLEGSGKKQNGIFVNDADEVTVDGIKARNYRANGFFFTNLNGYTMNHLIAAKTGVYGLYAFNTIGGRMINSEAYYVNDGAPLHRADAAAGQPDPDDRAQRRRLGQPDRLQRHEHALRDDHQEPLLQQRARDRPQRAGLARSSRRPRTTSSPTTTSSGTTSTSTRASRRTRSARRACRSSRRSAPGSCCSAAAGTWSRTTASTATTSPASPRSTGSCW